MQDLPLIPIPFKERWRNFKLATLPLMTFAVTVLGITTLWRQSVNPTTLPGQAEEIKSAVISPIAGVLLQLHVQRFQMVAKGTPIAVIQPIDNRAGLDLMRSQLENLRARLDPDMAARGAELNLQKLLLPLLEQKISLATAQSNLRFAESELQRAETLFTQKAMTAQAYDVTLKKKQALEIEVNEITKLVANLTLEVEKLHAPAFDEAGAQSVRQLLTEHQSKLLELEDLMGPIIIRAPIDGMVTVLERHAGESLTAGSSLLVISACQCEHVIGYLREPFPVAPQVGMEVLVRTRSLSRIASVGRITHVGVQFEPIINPLLHPGTTYEMGLPIEVSLPTNLQVLPGGIVDLTLTGKF